MAPNAASCDLSIIIVSWNVLPLLRDCLISIQRAAHADGTQPLDSQGPLALGPDNDRATLEVIVVDNGSTDGTPERLAEEFPWVRVIANRDNRGFTRANNQGFAQSTGRFVYFLNPDTQLQTGADGSSGLYTLYAAVRDNPGVAMAGPLLRYGDGSIQASRRCFPTPLTGFFESTWLARAWPDNPWARNFHYSDWPVEYRHPVDWVVGAAMLCRREALEQVSDSPAGQPRSAPFDEGFFMYSEETDLARRLSNAGWRTLFVPESVVTDFEGRSSDQAVAARHIHFNTSKVRYWRKWFGRGWSEALRTYLLAEYRFQIAEEQVKRFLGSQPALRAQRIAVYRDVLRSRLK